MLAGLCSLACCLLGFSRKRVVFDQHHQPWQRLGKEWWDAVSTPSKDSPRALWRHAMIKLALTGDVKVTPSDVKRSLGMGFQRSLDDFEKKLSQAKQVYQANQSLVSAMEMKKLHLETLNWKNGTFVFFNFQEHGHLISEGFHTWMCLSTQGRACRMSPMQCVFGEEIQGYPMEFLAPSRSLPWECFAYGKGGKCGHWVAFWTWCSRKHHHEKAPNQDEGIYK